MKRFLSYMAVLTLGACGSIIDGANQEVTLLTPGAENAECELYNKDYKGMIRTGETRSILKSDHDLVVSCLAPGNREKSMLVEAEIGNGAKVNILNGGIGLAYDYLDHSMYRYPSVITVDFRDIPSRSYGLPQYHAPDIAAPDTAAIEYMGPTTPLNEEDRFTPVYSLKKRSETEGEAPAASTNMSADQETVSSSPVEAPLTPSPSSGATADDLTRMMNPQVFRTR